MYPLLTSVVTQFFDEYGDPLVGGQVYTYEANTTTPKKTYADPDGNTPNTNPITLDAAGRAKIYLEEGAYRVRVLSKKGVLVIDSNKLSRYVTNTELAEYMSSVEDSLLELQEAKEAMNVMAQVVITESKDAPSGIAGLDEEAVIFPEQMPIYSKLGQSKYQDVKTQRAPNTVYTNDKDVGKFVSISFSRYGDSFSAALMIVNNTDLVVDSCFSIASSPPPQNPTPYGYTCSGYVPPNTQYKLHVDGARIPESWLESEV